MVGSLRETVFRKTGKTDEEQLIGEVHDVCRRIELAYTRMGLQSDENLVEAEIFEIESLKARYRYLLGIVKDNNFTNSSICVYSGGEP